MTMVRSLNDIGREIRLDWGAKINFAAKPYLAAMMGMGDINEQFGYDSGRSIVLYFLSNASTWRGAVAKRVKAELRGMLK